jgi:hypothetical protein
MKTYVVYMRKDSRSGIPEFQDDAMLEVVAMKNFWSDIPSMLVGLDVIEQECRHFFLLSGRCMNAAQGF